MMEGNPTTNEDKNSPERLRRIALLSFLKQEDGYENSEFQALLTQWKDEQIKIIDSIVNHEERALAQIESTLWLARLYLEGQQMYRAEDEFYDALEQAKNEEKTDFVLSIKAEMKTLGFLD